MLGAHLVRAEHHDAVLGGAVRLHALKNALPRQRTRGVLVTGAERRIKIAAALQISCLVDPSRETGRGRAVLPNAEYTTTTQNPPNSFAFPGNAGCLTKQDSYDCDLGNPLTLGYTRSFPSKQEHVVLSSQIILTPNHPLLVERSET